MHPRLEITGAIASALIEAAAKSAGAAAQAAPGPTRSRRGQTLQAGAATPLWNALAAAVRAESKRYGDQARLGRLLGLSRQRVHALLHGRHAMPDAERTLLLMAWLHARTSGVDPA